jgi:hypothetical protein
MSIKTKAGQIWTDSVAYVALFTGAGLSIAGNVANVVRTRGAEVDSLDVVLAVAFPALVVLMVEVFVSSRWRGLSWPMQILRWLGTLSIGAVAMRVSWVHLNELMASRGQSADVATLGPLAIDFLAIMATALILAGRGRSVPAPVHVDTPEEILANRQAELDRKLARTAPLVDVQPEHLGNADEYLARLDKDVDTAGDMWTRLASDASGQEPTLPVPVSPAPASRAKVDTIPDTAKELYLAWTRADESERPRVGQADMLVAAEHGVSTRTARGWRAALLVS